MANALAARLLAGRLLAAAAQAAAPAAAAAAVRAYAAQPTRRRPQWTTKETRAEKHQKQDALFRQKLLRQLTGADASTSDSSPSTSGSASTSAAAAASASSETSLMQEVLPTWLSSWLPSATQARHKKPVKSSSDSSKQQQGQEQEEDQGAKQKKEDKDDPWKGIEKQRNCSIDTFMARVRNNGADLEPAAVKPRKRSAVGPNADRLMFLRNHAHEVICGDLHLEEKDRIQADPAAVLKDMRTLRRIAKRTKYSVMEVYDCIRSYQNMRERVNDLIDLKESGRPMPQGRQEVDEALAQLKKEKDEKDMAIILQQRDFDNCPVRPWVSVLGSDTKCPNTHLRYQQCCGQRRSRAVPGI